MEYELKKDSRVDVFDSKLNFIGTAIVTEDCDENDDVITATIVLDTPRMWRPAQTDKWMYFPGIDKWRRLHEDMEHNLCFSQRDPGAIIKNST